MFVLTGRFGPYVQLGEQQEGTKKKPKRASLFASMTPETVTLDEALQLLSLPRVVGTDAEGREIVASPGRFGPYLKRSDGDTRSLSAEEQLFSVTLAEAEALYAQPKMRRGRQQKPPLAELGENPDNGQPVRVLEGRYGVYVTDGTIERDRAAWERPGRAHARRGRRPAARPGRGRRRRRRRRSRRRRRRRPRRRRPRRPRRRRPRRPAKKTAQTAAKKADDSPDTSQD